MKKISESQLKTAWFQIRARREKALDRAKIVADDIMAKFHCDIRIETTESETSFLPNIIFALSSSWTYPDSATVFVKTLTPVKFIGVNKKVIAGYFLKMSSKRGYYCYVREQKSSAGSW